MLAIRMQRTGRSGHAQFRIIVQDSRFSPTRGRVVTYLGSYNPHTKTAKLDTIKASQYLSNGAKPSDTVARLFKKEGVKLPDWIKLDEPKERDIRHPEKRRSTAPAEPEPATEAPTGEQPAAATETPAETLQEEAAPAGPTTEEPAIPEAPAEPVADAPAEEGRSQES